MGTTTDTTAAHTNEERTRRPVAVVTGASQGLGLALRRRARRRGAGALVIDARRADRLDATAAELADRTDVVGIAGDVTDRRAPADARRRRRRARAASTCS